MIVSRQWRNVWYRNVLNGMNTSVRRAGDMYCFLFYQTLTRGSLGGHLVYLLTTFLDRTLPYFFVSTSNCNLERCLYQGKTSNPSRVHCHLSYILAFMYCYMRWQCNNKSFVRSVCNKSPVFCAITNRLLSVCNKSPVFCAITNRLLSVCNKSRHFVQ